MSVYVVTPAPTFARSVQDPFFILYSLNPVAFVELLTQVSFTEPLLNAAVIPLGAFGEVKDDVPVPELDVVCEAVTFTTTLSVAIPLAPVQVIP